MPVKLRTAVVSSAWLATVLLTSSLISNTPDGMCDAVQEGARLAAALELKLQDLRSLPLPGPAALGKVASATGAEGEDFLDAELFAAGRDGEPALRIARVPVRGTEAGSFAVMALTEQMGFVRAAVVDGNGRVIGERQHFMEDLKWYDVPRLEGARPRSQLAKLRAEAVGEDDVQAALLVGLLALLQHMNQQASVFNLPRESQPFTVGEGARMIDSRLPDRRLKLGTRSPISNPRMRFLLRPVISPRQKSNTDVIASHGKRMIIKEEICTSEFRKQALNASITRLLVEQGRWVPAECVNKANASTFDA